MDTVINKDNKLLTDWKWVKLGEVCDRITKGGTPTTYGFKFQNAGIRFLKIENVKNGRVLTDSIRDYISEEAHEYQKKSQLAIGDILFSIAGTIGEMCAIKKEYLPANTNQAFAIIRGADEKFDLKFLQFQLESFVAKIKIKARGGAMNNVSLEDLKNFDAILQPKPTQQAIVSKIEELFSELDKGIENLRIAQQQLKTYRQSVLKWAFEGKLTNENVREGELQKGWKWVKIADICKVVRGGSPRPAGDPKYYDGNIPFLKVADLTKDDGIYLTTFKYTIKEAGLHKTRKISPNTLLLSNSGATLGVPKICMIDATMNDGVAAFFELDVKSNHYLYYFWLSKTR